MNSAMPEQEIEPLRCRITELETRVAQLTEELRLALMRNFGKTSEKLHPDQWELPFNEDPQQAPEDNEEAATITYQRSKAGRKPISESLPREDYYHDLTDEEKICACGHLMSKIGEDVNERVHIEPAKLIVKRHHHAKYGCSVCQGLSDESKGAVKTAKGEPALIPGSIVTPELLAFVWTNKFCDHLPFYRQEAGFERIGIGISRQDMSNWTLRIAGRELGPLIEALEQNIREGPVIQMDETPVKVLKLDHSQKDGKGWMWLSRGGPLGRPAVRYRFASGRGHVHAKEFLADWNGYLQTDGYQAYNLALEGTKITHVGCWAHARRKFYDANKVSASNLTKDALGRIGKLYKLDSDLRGLKLNDEEFVARRQSVLGEYLEGLRVWFDTQAADTLPSGKTGQAFAYVAGQWDKLVRFIDHAWLTPDNNKAENAIRPFVLGRKNWLFAGTDLGAEASCRVFTLIETAKANGLEPHGYLTKVLRALPDVRQNGDWKSLLPWNLSTGKN